MVQTPENERLYSSTADLVADSKYYEHSGFVRILRVPLLRRSMGSFVVQNNGPVDLLRSMADNYLRTLSLLLVSFV